MNTFYNINGKNMNSKWNRKGKKKLWVEIPVDLYDKLIINCEKRNITFTKYINRILLRHTIEENRYI